MRDLVAKARDLAHRAHAGQVDKAGRPYIEHVARVAAAVCDDPIAEVVAWLHDVIEDCHPDFSHEVYYYFPDVINLIVGLLTHDPSVSRLEYYSLIRTNKVAIRVKLADIADNSSEERLALLDEKTAARLRRKYTKAIAALTGKEAA